MLKPWQPEAFEVAAIISDFRYRFTSEAELQDGIAEALTSYEIQFEREVRLSEADRIDFLVAGGIGIEVKIDGAANEVLRQVHRYVQHDQVTGVVVATNRSRHRNLPKELNGKPVRVAFLTGASL